MPVESTQSGYEPQLFTGPVEIRGRFGRPDFDVEQDIWRELHQMWPDRFWSSGPEGLLYQLVDGRLSLLPISALRPIMRQTVEYRSPEGVRPHRDQ